MATLLSSVTENTTGTGASHTGPATVFVYGTFGGCSVQVEVSPDDTNYVPVDLVGSDTIVGNRVGRFASPGACGVGGQGTYFIRAVVSGAGSSTSVSAVTTQ